tara:strand:- start:634 stop:2820 length:2187 start_codon:yes stop_codon:yes gene_type:complete
MRVIFKLVFAVLLITFLFLTYLTLIGIETDKFNSQIKEEIKTINKDLDVDLKKIKLILDPIQFKLNIKTLGSRFKNKNEIVEIESIKAEISLRSLINSKFSVKNLEISTKSIEVNNLIAFIRSLKNTPQLFILEKIIDKGYLIADIKLEFDAQGKIKDNYTIRGFVKDIKFSLLKKYNFKELSFNFEFKKDNLFLSNTSLDFNNLGLISEEILIQNKKNNFYISGKIDNKILNFNKDNLELFINPFFPDLKIEKLNFSSKNTFSLILNKKFQFKDLKINSKISIDELVINNSLGLEKFFPQVKENITLISNDLELKYTKDNLLIAGNGDLLFQNNKDSLSYTLNKKDNIFGFKTQIKIKDNPLKINLLNYEKNNKDEAFIRFEGIKKENEKILIDLFSLKEKLNTIVIEKLTFDKQFGIIDINNVKLDYIDKEKRKNLINLKKKDKEYFLTGSAFNANSLIEELLEDNDSKPSIIDINSKININIDKIYIDNDYSLNNFSGFLSFKDKKILTASLIGNFSNIKKLKFTINTVNNNKVITLFSDKAKPIVKRYKFIKGFDEGLLDFISTKKSKKSTSTLKIYDFKLKELPVLTKILTLASLQGIADILSGEGIRFDEFEMNFKKEKDLISIEEIYAIGPAISILMDGYVEKNKLVSLRGTLVPATTINKAIGSIPLLGKILVGSRTGEGVFGVSFKIKGPPKNLETTVNPIKTLTPRFITRTLEKIKKN